jgi:ATP-dependent Clp protease ATP-binding subunit ClpA
MGLENFTDNVREAMQLCKQEAERFHHEYIGTEHILLGLIKEGSGVATKILNNQGIDLGIIRLEVEKLVQPGPECVPLGAVLTPQARKVIDYSIEEARDLNLNYLGTENLLIGLLREQEGVAAQVLMNLGLTMEDARREMHNILTVDTSTEASVRNFVPPNKTDLPASVKHALEELHSQIDQLNQQHAMATGEHDFEKSAYLRDQANNLKRQMQTIADWPVGYSINPSWLSCNGGAVTRIALAIRENRRWEELPILADALEEAGCTDHEILGPCRRSQGHAGHCWVLDLLLRKQ